MNYHELFTQHAQFRDFVTFNNFVGFVVAREYIENYAIIGPSDEQITYNFYKLLLKVLQGGDESIIPSIADHSCMSRTLSDLVIERLESFRDIDYLVAYVQRSSLKQIFSRDSGEMEDPTSIIFHQSSLIGQFLRKVVVAFTMLHFDQVNEFLKSFYARYYVIRNHENPVIPQEPGSLSYKQVEAFCDDVIERSGRLGSLSPSEFEALVNNLETYRACYPDMFKTRYASHLVAMRQGNLTKAETNLFKAFEMAIALPQSEPQDALSERKLVDGWTRMTLGAADMHYRFGQIPQARSYLHQALAQALETNDTLGLRFAKMAHEVLNPLGEPFRFRTTDMKPSEATISSDLLLAELRCKLYKLIGSVASPKEVLLTYLNSEIAPKSEALSTALLDLSFLFSYYGYRIMATTLLQCVIIMDSLCPCSVSDSILSLSISQLARVFAVNGSPAVAVQILKSASETIGLFGELAYFERARVETQLEQSFRMGRNLEHCARLVDNLALFCPWEAYLRRANMELKRGNQSLAVDILQALAERAEKLRTTTGFEREEVAFTEKFFGQSDDVDVETLLGTLEPPPASGGVGALVHFEVRARIAMSEVFACNNIFLEAMKQLEIALELSQRYHLRMLANTCIIMISTVASFSEIAVENPLPEDTSLFDIFTEVCHQADPSLANNLINMKMWLSFLAGYPNGRFFMLSAELCSIGVIIKAAAGKSLPGADQRTVMTQLGTKSRVDEEVKSVLERTLRLVKETWKNHLQESAAFFGNIGDIPNLRRIKSILNSLNDLGEHSKTVFAKYLLPLS